MCQVSLLSSKQQNLCSVKFLLNYLSPQTKMSYEYYADAFKRSQRRNRYWYQEHLMPALLAAKERQERDVDTSIALAGKLQKVYNEPVEKPKRMPLHDVVPYESDDLMMPIEPDVLNLLYGSTEKGAAQKYLKTRYKKAPDDKFYFRLTSNWDYGWQQKQSRLKARDVNRGRCAILRDTFYRKNNLGPDPPHYTSPAGGEFSKCSH